MTTLTKLLAAFLILGSAGCGGININLGDAATADDEDKKGGDDNQDDIDNGCPPTGQPYCVETAPGAFETQDGTTNAQCETQPPKGKIVDLNLCDQQYACTEDAMVICREISRGIYMEDAVGRQGPECKFPTEGAVDASFCKGKYELKDLIALAKEKDGETVSVTGAFGDWRFDPEPACAEPGPFVGVPTLSTSYRPGRLGFGIENETTQMKAGFSKDDARTENSEFLEKIEEGAMVTLHGIFKYKTVIPVCGNGSIVHPSGVIELDLMKK
jgi:hypothetical protein